MSVVNRNQLVDDLAGDLVARFAHQEMDLFRATSEAYFKTLIRCSSRELARMSL